MNECTAEDGLKLLSVAGISLPFHETELFKIEFKKVYESSEKSYNFVESVWKVYSEIIPSKSCEGDELSFQLVKAKRDENFQNKIMDSGLSEKLKSGISIEDLSKSSRIFS